MLDEKTRTLFGLVDYSKHPLYNTWKNLWKKCYEPGSPSYHLYGEKGIGMSLEWRRSFKTFADDMGDKPTWSYVIALIDEKEGFKKGNCVWVSRTRMAITKSRSETRYLNGVKGVTYCNRRNIYVANICLGGKKKYLGSFYVFEDAVAARKAAEEELFAPILNSLKPKSTTPPPASPTPHLSDVDLLS